MPRTKSAPHQSKAPSGLKSKVAKISASHVCHKKEGAKVYPCDYSSCSPSVAKCYNDVGFSGGICSEHLALAQTVIDRHNIALELWKSETAIQEKKNAEAPARKDESEEDDEEEDFSSESEFIGCSGCYDLFPQDEIEMFEYEDSTMDPLCTACYDKAESKKQAEM